MENLNTMALTTQLCAGLVAVSGVRPAPAGTGFQSVPATKRERFERVAMSKSIHPSPSV